METVRDGDSWRRQGDDGTWYRWNEATRAWEYDDPAPAATPSPTGDYRSPAPVGRALATLLGALTVLNLAAVVAFFIELGTLGTAGDTGTPTADRVGMLTMPIATVQLATVPVFLVWFHRLYSNLPALGATELRFGRGWAIGAWFVPVLNLWRPKQIANDIWRATDTDADATPAAPWPARPVGGVVHLWWGLYLLSNLANQAVVMHGVGAETAAELRTQALAETGAATLDALAAFVAMAFVVRLTARQEQRAAPVHQE